MPLLPYNVSTMEEFMDDLPAEAIADFEATPAGKSFPLAQVQADPEEDAVMKIYEHEYQARTIDTSVILKYLYMRCQAYDTIKLPEGKSYKVEVIDTWNMTKTTLFEKVEGKIKVELPGKPYMAILATEVYKYQSGGDDRGIPSGR